jgi:hypothetical protein
MQADRLESRLDAVFECLLPWQVRKFHIKPAKLAGGGTA